MSGGRRSSGSGMALLQVLFHTAAAVAPRFAAAQGTPEWQTLWHSAASLPIETVTT